MFFSLDLSFQETQMVQASYRKEVEMLKQNLLAQAQVLEGTHQRVTELEMQLSKKEHLIVEQKKFLEDLKCQTKWVQTLWKDPKSNLQTFAQVVQFTIPCFLPNFTFISGQSCRPLTSGIRLRGESLSSCRLNSFNFIAWWRWRLLRALPKNQHQGAELALMFIVTPGQT